MQDPLANTEFTPQEVYFNLPALNPAKASGPDSWPILSLKECGHYLCVYYYQFCLTNFAFLFTLPDAWKEALVTPYFHNKVIALLHRPIHL